MTITYGQWDEAWQRARFETVFNPDASTIIEIAGRAVGEIVVDWDRDPVFLSNIELLPEVRGKGIGTEVILGVLVLLLVESVFSQKCSK